MLSLPRLTLSHFELFVDDMPAMLDFYTGRLGFVITDRDEDGMVFLSNNPKEHHQLVLNQRKSTNPVNSPMDHIAFRLGSLSDLREYHANFKKGEVDFQSVSHGNSWSIYFRDPENNRFELFTDTPWHVDQPCRFEINLDLSDEQLYDFTQAKIRNLPGYVELVDWQRSHVKNLGVKQAEQDQ